MPELTSALFDADRAYELDRRAATHDWIGEVRGTGAFWAIELVADPETGILANR